MVIFKRIDFLFSIAIFILGCANDAPSSTATSPQSTSRDTLFQNLTIDSTTYPGSKAWDFRYFYRTRALTRRLKLDSLQNGVSGFEMRVWRLTSDTLPQELYDIKENNGSWQLTRYRVKLDVQTWNDPNWYQPKLKVYNTTMFQPVQVSRSFIDSLSIDTLWSYPSEAAMVSPKYGAAQGCHSVCIELADRHRYKFAFYMCPDLYDDDRNIHKKIVAVVKSLAAISLKQ